jgi:hypothetical protein
MALGWKNRDSTGLLILYVLPYAHFARKYVKLTNDMKSVSDRMILSAKILDGLKNLYRCS